MDPIGFVQALLLSFSAIFIMEIGDKTQLTAFALSLKYRSPLRVFLGVLTGLSGVTIIAVFLGVILKSSIDFQILKPLIAFLFILGGVIILGSEMKKRNVQDSHICPVSLDSCEKPRENCPEMGFCEQFLDATVRKGAFLRSATFMFFAELGDKTMLMGLGLATQFDPLGVFTGALLALAVVNGIGVFAGEKIARKIPRRIIGLLSGLLFLITGLLIFIY
ncbi:MAG: TMEM165/GDT1 family protein [Candidatus Hodarchaeales archaeon]|jgi:putative Ca2+/H+ antiporter (TMEM165/GDT1 family)